ncbi:MAG TPA: chromate efflux transporter [Bacteroidota bacterium]|nr:chromate efflux transporter [Bacteroidota bacterium]
MNRDRKEPNSLGELAKLFLRLGVLGFGGPAAHIAMMEDEVVKRRGWLSHDHFLDLLGVTNLIPGPNSTEMAIHIGLVRNGWRGLVVAGICFIIPAIAITLLLAWLYVSYGSLPQAVPLIVGMRPAIIAIILGAVYRLGRPLFKKGPVPPVIGLVVACLAILRINEIALLFAGGVAAVLWSVRDRMGSFLLPVLATGFAAPAAVQAAGFSAAPEGVSASALGLFFLKIGSVLYGSGYVLVAFLQGGLVESRHWLTQTQLLDAIAVGQFTPGPVLSTATFIGYIILGLPGATVATAGIFLPSFVFVLLIGPFVPKLRTVPVLSAFLDGVNGAALGLILAVCISLGAATLVSPLLWFLFVAAGAAILIWRVHPGWLVIGSAAIGWAAASFFHL